MSYNNYRPTAPPAQVSTKPDPPQPARNLPNQRDVPDHVTPSARLLRPIHPTLPSRISKGHTRQVKAMAWSCNGQVLATAGDDRNVRLWDYKKPAEIANSNYRAAEHFIQSNPEPLLSTPSPSTSSAPSTSTSKTTASPVLTTCDCPIILLSFSPRDPEILAIATSGSLNGVNEDMEVIYPGNEEVLTEDDKSGENKGKGKEGEKGSGEVKKVKKMDGPKVMIWNVRKRQIQVTIPLPSGTPVALTFHPSSLQLAIVFMEGRIGQDIAWFASRPHTVSNPNASLLIEDPLGGKVEQMRRDREKAWTRELSADPAFVEKDRWEIRKDIKLGEKGYKVPTGDRVNEFNGAMFSPCGRKFYVGNHDGTLYAWSYPVQTLAPPPVATEEESTLQPLHGHDQSSPQQNSTVPDGNGATNTVGKETTKIEIQDEEEDDQGEGEDDEAAQRRRRKSSAAPQAEDEDAESTEVNGSVKEKVEGVKQADEDVEMAGGEVAEVKEGIAVAGEGIEQQAEEGVLPADETGNGLDSTRPNSNQTDVEMKDANEETQPANTAAAIPVETTAPVHVAKKEPERPAQKLEFAFKQNMHVGCLNCMDIDPKRRYIATGGSEGLVNLTDLSDWISVKTFDSYTEEIKHLKFSWDGEYIAAAGEDRCIDIMATATGTTVHRIHTKTNVQCLAWSPARHVLCYALEGHASGTAGQQGDWYYCMV